MSNRPQRLRNQKHPSHREEKQISPQERPTRTQLRNAKQAQEKEKENQKREGKKSGKGQKSSHTKKVLALYTQKNQGLQHSEGPQSNSTRAPVISHHWVTAAKSTVELRRLAS